MDLIDAGTESTTLTVACVATPSHRPCRPQRGALPAPLRRYSWFFPEVIRSFQPGAKLIVRARRGT